MAATGSSSGSRMPQAKRTKLMDDSSDNESDSGVQLDASNGFKINEEFAKRFEHNKKREDMHRLEEKFGSSNAAKRKREQNDDDEDDSSSTDEDEDDDAELATVDVDDEIMATLNAIKSKDPRVYDANVKFYREYDPEAAGKGTEKKEKPMYLSDYHRQNLLAGNADDDEEESKPAIKTYQEEQDQMRRDLVGSMHALAKPEDDEGSEDEMLVAKKKQAHENLPDAPKPKKSKKITDRDIEEAEKDPETYLSNFMAARAWLPGEGSRFQPLESDDSEDDQRADEFEEAYNMRFEDPATANEKLKSFSRDVGKYGVRREEKSGRQKAREREREQKELARKEREEDKARYRKLKIEEAEQKVKRIKEAAGLRGKQVNLDEWKNVIEGDFDDEKWEQEMQQRFGDGYYAEEDAKFGSDDEEAGEKKSRKPKKPKWDDDIDIKDLVPDFDDKPDITLSDDEEGGAPLPEDSDEEEGSSKPKKKTKKDKEKEKTEAKRAARKERQKIEEMVDASLPLHDPKLSSAATSKAPVVGFRYRETSPTSFGLSARDILFADDSRLNEFAGLKKMAAFRDPEKKKRDKKKFSKKARLRQWRKDTFGQVDEPTGGFERILGNAASEPAGATEAGEGNVKEGARKKKRSKKRKGEKGEAVEA